jgi:hypothetical protein
MRKSKQERITELRNLLGLDPEDIESEEAKRIQELTEEEVVGEIYLLKKYGPKKEEKDEDEMTLYCNLM